MRRRSGGDIDGEGTGEREREKEGRAGARSGRREQ